MARRNKPPGPPPGFPSVLPDDFVRALSEGVRALLGPAKMALAERHGVNPEDVIRFQSVRQKCFEARERKGLDLKQAAKRLGVPRYRIDDIESGLFGSIQPETMRAYLEFLGLTHWYAEWASGNPELAHRIETGHRTRPPASREPEIDGVRFHGEIVAVKARIRLIRSFDEVSHQYQGYTLLIATPGSEEPLRVAIGPAAHEKHRFRIGDVISGKGQPVPEPKQEWANLYKVSALKVEERGPAEQDRPPDPEGGIAEPLEVYRANGHLRLDPRTCATACARCPWGLTMVTEVIVDHWKPWIKRWRTETHCYGPRDCPRYRAGAARKVPGRQPGMVWVDNDVERESEW